MTTKQSKASERASEGVGEKELEIEKELGLEKVEEEEKKLE